jgi:hypothetical protein
MAGQPKTSGGRPRVLQLEVAMSDVELDEGPVGIIMSYLHKEDHEN